MKRLGIPVAILAYLTTVVMVSIGGPVTAKQDPNIWIAPQSILPQPLNSSVDFLEMFQADSPWKFTASHVNAFKLYGSFVGHATPDQLETVFTDLQRRHIAIALEVGVLDVSQSTRTCGGMGLMEGYGTATQARRLSDKIKAAGGRIQYLVMDEPLYFGHYSNRPHACRDPTDELLQQIQPTLTVYLNAFPNLIVGEVEPARFPSYRGWQEDLSYWAQAYKKMTRRPLAFFHIDVPWPDDGKRVPGADLASRQPRDTLSLYQFLTQLRAQHLIEKIGVIHDGDPADATGADWVRNAQRHIRILEINNGLQPDDVIFQSWMRQPERSLPETAPDSLTGLVRYYVGLRANMTAVPAR